MSNPPKGFIELPLMVGTIDGRNFTLIFPSDYIAQDGTRYRMPIGAKTDGASTPKEIWLVIPPFGLYWPAAVLHDCGYQDTLMIVAANGDTSKATLTKSACDSLLKEGMESLGVGKALVDTIYAAVVVGGDTAFNLDRAAAKLQFSGANPPGPGEKQTINTQ